MMIPLDTIKQHLRVEHPEDDALLTHYLESASEYVQRTCDVLPDPAPAPAPVQSAVLLLVAHFYENRASTTEIPPGVRLLLAPYRSFAH